MGNQLNMKFTCAFLAAAVAFSREDALDFLEMLEEDNALVGTEEEEEEDDEEEDDEEEAASSSTASESESGSGSGSGSGSESEGGVSMLLIVGGVVVIGAALYFF